MSRANAKEWFKSISLDTHTHTHKVYDATKHETKCIHVTRYNALLLKVIIIYFMSLLSSPKCVRALRKWWCATRSSRALLTHPTTIRSRTFTFFPAVCVSLLLLLSFEIFHSLNFNWLCVMTKPKTWIKRYIKLIAIRISMSIPTDKRDNKIN